MIRDENRGGIARLPTVDAGEPDPRRLDLLKDVPLDISVELGQTRLSIEELLNLGPGSVIELDKVAGEPLDILVNQRLVARGEAVVVNDKFGIRITDIISPTERVTRLK
jgi:flagellar motor switch protein FliN/FliY